MKTVRADAEGLVEAARVILAGGVAVIPTDTVYGLAAHPDFPKAVERLYTIKGRDARKPIALLVADCEAAEKLAGGLDERARRLAARGWPGALTLVLKRADGKDYEGVRVPNQAWTRELLRACGGALRVTSANLSGASAAVEAAETFAAVGLQADLVVDGGVSSVGRASTVIKVEPTSLKLLREGPVELLTLASGSSRRAKILSDHGVDFEVVKSDAQEVSYADDPERTVRENALAKGAAVKRRKVLSADTIVWYNGKIYGKPRDLSEAKEFLRELAGRTHTVFTGVAYDGEVRVVVSEVTFKALTEEAIDEYVELVRPLDRAGAYDIDESGELLVKMYTGEYENIMGLPTGPLKEWGICS